MHVFRHLEAPVVNLPVRFFMQSYYVQYDATLGDGSRFEISYVGFHTVFCPSYAASFWVVLNGHRYFFRFPYSSSSTVDWHLSKFMECKFRQKALETEA
jgi:hypothetical protein